MNKFDLANALGSIQDKELLRVYELRKYRLRMNFLIKTISYSAACVFVAAFLIIGVYNRALTMEIGGVERKYNRHFNKTFTETHLTYVWEDMFDYERFSTVNYNGREYSADGTSINVSLLDEFLGARTLETLDDVNNICTIDSEIYTVKGVVKEKGIAIKLNDTYYLYKASEYIPPATFGQLISDYSLSENLTLPEYDLCSNYKEKGHYKLNDGADIWKLLLDCADAPYVETDNEWTFEDKKYYSFTASSTNLGIYKKVFAITVDGFIYTNIFDYSYVFEIGEEKAAEIISFAKENSEKAKADSYMPTFIGKIVEITDDYVLIDDSIRCKWRKSGIQVKILRSSPYFNREFLYKTFEVGDVVEVTFFGIIDDNNAISDARTIDDEFILKEE